MNGGQPPSNPRRLVKDLSAEELKAWLQAQGQPAFRLKQIREWLYHRQAISFEEMANLPAPLRQKLAADFIPFALETIATQTAQDGTVKFLHRLHDGETIESVRISAPDRTTVCISTQVGCPVRCTFCASGRDGLVRDLTPAEIVDQVIAANRSLGGGARVDNIVVMGMGEPLLNLDNLLVALDLVGSPDGLGIGARSITISTSGIVPGIHRLAELGRQWNLALSLHATTEEARARLIPQAYRYPLEEILQACIDYFEKTSRIVTLEYALIAGRNDTDAEMRQLAAIARRLRAKVNLIPYNPTTDAYRPPEDAGVRHAVALLEKSGVTVTVRREKGAEIQAACGQLRRQNRENRTYSGE